ncbi:transcriptional regulator [Rhodotorula toruloides]|uniref:Transcriptional regulator n=1 Tax=Rhodotorula toruloides TaxID=5286 RepID=A0A511KBT7_RHOTO|nr:transcriptional regulator [Rhodotorula toruloides]
MPLLLPAPLLALLRQLVAPTGDGSPHTALVASLQGGHSVLVSHFVPTKEPWPPVRPSQDEEDEDQRASRYAALAGGAWQAQQSEGSQEGGKGQEQEPFTLESGYGRIASIALGGFLLVLVGTDVAPWKVLDKKIRAAAEQLRQPLSGIEA